MSKFLIVAVAFILFQNQAHASFIESWMRYPPPHGIYFIVKQQFPNAHDYNGCIKITDNNRGLLGVNSTIDGKPSSANPGVSFQLWYLDCLKQFANIEFQIIVQKEVQVQDRSRGFPISSKLYEEFAGTRAFDLENALIRVVDRQYGPGGAHFWFNDIFWPDVTPTDRTLIVTTLVRKHLGPEASYKYLGIGRSERQIVLLLLKAINAALADPSELNLAFLHGLDIDEKKPKMTSIIKLVKVLTLSLDEFLLE